MKIRIGFVSNSSGSSYLINCYGITLAIIARGMFKVVIRDYYNWEKNKRILKFHKIWSKNLGIALRMKEVRSGKLGVTLPSTNEDTYIIKKKNLIYITTCRNHTWDILDEERNYGEDDNKIYKYMENKFFYNIKNKIIHGYEKYDENHKTLCKKCKYNDGFYVIDKTGIKLCSFCYTPQGKSDKQVIDEISVKQLKKFNSMKFLKIV